MGRLSGMRLAIGLSALLAFSGTAASAADGTAPFLACGGIMDKTARLECYDEAAKKAQTGPSDVQTHSRTSAPALSGDSALKAREAALAEREAALKARETELAARAVEPENEPTLFGISLGGPSKPDAFTRSADMPNQQVERDEDGAVEAITSELAEWSKDSLGRVTVVLTNGQVWRQSDGDEIRIAKDPEKPHVARIERGAIGSFTLKVNDSNRLVKVRRIDGQTKRR